MENDNQKWSLPQNVLAWSTVVHGKVFDDQYGKQQHQHKQYMVQFCMQQDAPITQKLQQKTNNKNEWILTGTGPSAEIEKNRNKLVHCLMLIALVLGV